VILNRLNSDNTQEELVPGMEFREQSPFLLYKRDSGSFIHWFLQCQIWEDRCVCVCVCVCVCGCVCGV